jgi:hypothetical protein
MDVHAWLRLPFLEEHFGDQIHAGPVLFGKVAEDR